MSRVLETLEPKAVFHFFEDLTRIPHGSRNTKAISDYCVAFAKERGLWVYQDALNNVIIKKPASATSAIHSAALCTGGIVCGCARWPAADHSMPPPTSSSIAPMIREAPFS